MLKIEMIENIDKLGRKRQPKACYINNVYFEVVRPRKIDTLLPEDYAFLFTKNIWRKSKTLAECYKKPSVVKTAIYCKWVEWAKDCTVGFGIASYNCNIFTLQGLLTDEHGKYIGVLYITPLHNRIRFF